MVEILAERWLTAALMIALKSTLLLLAAAAVARLLRSLSAAARHLIWLAVLLAILVIPMLSLLLPRWTVGVSMPMAMNPSPAGEPLPAIRLPARSEPARLPRTGATAAPAAASPAALTPRSGLALSWPAAILATWLAGALVVIGRTLHGFRALRRLERGSSRAVGSLMALAAAVQADLGVRRRVRLLIACPADGSVLPMTWGLWRPVVLLPSGAAQWPEKRLRAVLMHELAHVRRNDWLAQMAAVAALAAYWFHPLVWWTAARRRLESERACDDQVLTRGIPPSEYATHLLEVVQMAKTTRTHAGPVASMAASTDVERRLHRVLDPHCQRGGVSRPVLLLSAAALAGLLLPLAVLRVRPASAAPPGRRSPAVSTPQAARSRVERAEVAALRARLAETQRVLAELHGQLDAARTELRQSQARSAALQARAEQLRAQQRRLKQQQDYLQQQSRTRAAQERSRGERVVAPPGEGRGADDLQQQVNRRKLELFANRLAEIELRLFRLQSSSTQRPDSNPEIHELTRERALLLMEAERVSATLRRSDEAARHRDRVSEGRLEATQSALAFVERKLQDTRRMYRGEAPQVRELEARRKSLQLRLEAETAERRVP